MLYIYFTDIFLSKISGTSSFEEKEARTLYFILWNFILYNCIAICVQCICNMVKFYTCTNPPPVFHNTVLTGIFGLTEYPRQTDYIKLYPPNSI